MALSDFIREASNLENLLIEARRTHPEISRIVESVLELHLERATRFAQVASALVENRDAVDTCSFNAALLFLLSSKATGARQTP
jgi:hypothetical protein